MKLYKPSAKDKASGNPLVKFYRDIPEGEEVLVVVGGGVAALTYLYTHAQEIQQSHIVILGERGYWAKAAHRLAQPHHIFALPHKASDGYINPAEHDEERNILPHNPDSAYIHSHDFQERLIGLEESTLDALRKQGKQVCIANKAWVTKIEKPELSLFTLEIQGQDAPIFANKVIIATGAGPERSLPSELKAPLLSSASNDAAKVEEKILNYTDVLTSVSKKCHGKDILIYGGGATAAWAMEVADLTAKPLAWVARSGFELAETAGPRVNAIIAGSRAVQVHGAIESIVYQQDEDTGENKLLIKVKCKNNKGKETSQSYLVDYLFNCIGQEPYEIGGLPTIISQNIRDELHPCLDKNYVTGGEESCILGWETQQKNFIILGAALGTYYDKDRRIKLPSAISDFLPISGQVGITIASVVASVCALANFMPFSQNPQTGEVDLLSLNIHVMNATQLAVYFTTCFPEATASEVNKAVTAFISARKKTDFGLSSEEVERFIHNHFGNEHTPPADHSAASNPSAFFATKASSPKDSFSEAIAVLDQQTLKDDVLLPEIPAPTNPDGGDDDLSPPRVATVPVK